jgi:hypothetical protein
MTFSELANFIWSVADLLRGDYKQADYGKVILPFTLLRRLDCVLDGTKQEVLAEYAKRKEEGVNLDVFLKRKSKQSFYNVSPFTVPGLLADPGNIRQNLIAYIGDFSADAREVFELFKFNERIAELDDRNLLYMLVQKFASIDLHPDTVPNETMGLVFEDLIRRFAEASNETAGEHFTPRDAIKLIVQCLFVGDSDALSKPGVVRSLYDPTAGTGGMLSVGQHELHKMNPGAKLALFGQELNAESFAICKADMLIKGQNPGNIRRGNTLSADGFPFEKFDYSLSNPPFGVDWKKVLDFIKTEHEKKGWRLVEGGDDMKRFQPLEMANVEVGSSREVVLAVSVSYPIDTAALQQAFGADMPIARLTSEEVLADRYWSEEKQRAYAVGLRDAVQALMSAGIQRIHMVLAAPASLSIRMGMAYDSRLMPDLIVYQYEKSVSPPYPWGIQMPTHGQAHAKVFRRPVWNANLMNP